MKRPLGLLMGATFLVCALSISSSFGVVTLTFVNDTNSLQGDVLDFNPPDSDPDFVFELGENSDNGGNGPPGFDPSFLIDVEFGGVYVGPASDPLTKGAGFDVTITIENISLINWEELWYIADAAPDSPTMITNYDGLAGTSPNAPSLFAFKIDAVGFNKPLIDSNNDGFGDGDINLNGIFDIGETWEFILQDFTSDLNPSLIQSIGLGDGFSPPGDDASSGSIVGIPLGGIIPEPSRALLLLAGLVSMVAVRRRS